MAYCYDINVQKTPYWHFDGSVCVVLFNIVEMKNHINVNIRNRSKELELHGHKGCLFF